MKKPLNIGHRGGRALWPENTLFALGEAARSGIDGAEIDVQLAGDGALVVFHDFRLNPELCRDVNGHWVTPRGEDDLPLVRDLGHAELSAFDVGRVKPGTDYARVHGPATPRDGERIPLLRDAIAAVRAVNPRFRLFIEIKTSAEDRSLSAAPEHVADAIIAELRRTRFIGNTVLVGFDWPALIHARGLEPSLPCWFTTMRRPLSDRPEPWAGGFDPMRFGGSIPEAIASAGGRGWLCSSQEANPESIFEAWRMGLRFGVWTVNEEHKMRELVELGVDAIITDRPDLLAAITSERTTPGEGLGSHPLEQSR
jgi:glycerophosphoryl diester phosphodiesterase